MILTSSELPSHTHAITSTSTGAMFVGSGPGGAYASGEHIAAAANIYAPTGVPNSPLDAATISVTTSSSAAMTGDGNSFDVRSPYLALLYCQKD